MTKRNLFLAMAAIVIAARCATAPPPPPASAPAAGNDRFLVDPRIGFTATDNLNRRFESGWRSFLSGDLATARKAFGDLRVNNPDYLPASLGEAAIDIKEGNLDRASQLVERAIARNRDYTAAQIYEAEIAAREHRLHSANQLYTALAAAPGAPDVIKERLAEVRQQLFDELLAFASTAPNAESVRLLREALTIDPHARTARLLLVQRLMADKNWEEARRVLTPLTSSADVDSTDVQSALAEIEIGQGQYEQAIVRYERLARREKDPRFGKRLEEVKEEWTATNMPPQYRRALESEAIRRDDLAVLLYWKVASIRFAQNLGAPPIAVDIGEVAGRDEIIRAIALGVLPVDAVTRRVNPFAQVNAAAFTRLAARVLFLRGAACARQLQSSSPEPAHSQAILAACRVNDPGLTLPPDAPVSGRTAAAVFEQIDNALSR